MPHQCLNCGKIFEKGSPHLLKGCPDCGGKKFFYTKKLLGSEERERLLEKEKVDMDAVAHIVEEREGDKEWMHIQPDNIRDILQDIREQKRQVAEEVEQESRRVESIDVDDPGSYRINVKRLLDDESIVIHRDGSYLIHLPSLFTEKERREK